MGTVRLWATRFSPREPARTHTRVPSHHTNQRVLQKLARILQTPHMLVKEHVWTLKKSSGFRRVRQYGHTTSALGEGRRWDCMGRERTVGVGENCVGSTFTESGSTFHCDSSFWYTQGLLEDVKWRTAWDLIYLSRLASCHHSLDQMGMGIRVEGMRCTQKVECVCRFKGVDRSNYPI